MSVIPLATWLLFALACVALAATPGPNQLYLVSRTLAQGRAAGFVSLAGTASGLALHIVAAILGDSVNYSIGRWIGPKVFEHDHRFIRREHLQKTQAFYDRYGAVTIIIGRFVPIVRTFAPFLAGVAGMHYPRFLAYNVIGGVLWVGSLVYAGYLFGNLPWVKGNLTLIVVAIVVVSLIPAVTTFVREHRRARGAARP